MNLQLEIRSRTSLAAQTSPTTILKTSWPKSPEQAGPSSNHADPRKMSKENIEAIYALSPMQEGMFFHSLYAPQSGVYFQQLNCVLEGRLNIDAFQRAWQRVVDRHAILRTAFVWKRLE